MTSIKEKESLVRMFSAYCSKALRNASTDLAREKARMARKERLFSDMRRSEVEALAAPYAEAGPEVVFDAFGLPIVVVGEELCEALATLSEAGRGIVLLSYFAGWSDGRIAREIGMPRSTVQFRRSSALRELRKRLEGG